jgi:hypothetical protein
MCGPDREREALRLIARLAVVNGVGHDLAGLAVDVGAGLLPFLLPDVRGEPLLLWHGLIVRENFVAVDVEWPSSRPGVDLHESDVE